MCACFVDFFFPYSFPLGALSIREIIIYREEQKDGRNGMEGRNDINNKEVGKQ